MKERQVYRKRFFVILKSLKEQGVKIVVSKPVMPFGYWLFQLDTQTVSVFMAISNNRNEQYWRQKFGEISGMRSAILSYEITIKSQYKKRYQ